MMNDANSTQSESYALDLLRLSLNAVESAVATAISRQNAVSKILDFDDRYSIENLFPSQDYAPLKSSIFDSSEEIQKSILSESLSKMLISAFSSSAYECMTCAFDDESVISLQDNLLDEVVKILNLFKEYLSYHEACEAFISALDAIVSESSKSSKAVLMFTNDAEIRVFSSALFYSAAYTVFLSSNSSELNSSLI